MIDKPIKIYVEYMDSGEKNTYKEVLDFPANSTVAYIEKFFKFVGDKYKIIGWEPYDFKVHNPLIFSA